MNVTLFDLACVYLGEREKLGIEDNPLIRYWHRLAGGESPDEVAWCSAALCGFAHLLPRLPRSHSKAARSWLKVGRRLADPLREATRGWDVVVLTRGSLPQPGADVLQAPGHVGLFSQWLGGGARVEVLGGNQGNAVSLASFNSDRILAVQRLWEDA